MKRLASYHVHTRFCDGSASAREMLEAACALGMTDIAFTAHAMWPFASQWHMATEKYEAYFAEINALKSEFKNRIRVLCGLEADYLKGASIPDYCVYRDFDPDFLIGSVHFLSRQKPGTEGYLCSIDGPASEVARGLQECFRGNGRKMVQAYWSAVREMIATCNFDMIGHLDVIRKRNGDLRFFDEGERWYRRELEETVRTISRSGKVVEINTGGIARGAIDSVYPSPELLGLLGRRGVPVTISSDAHHPKDLLCAYKKAVDTARGAGYHGVMYREGPLWREGPFPEL